MRITGRESRSARALLKWNVSELVSRSSYLRAQQIEEFEEGHTPMPQAEMDELVNIYQDEGIQFLTNGQVTLKPKEKEKPGAGSDIAGQMFGGAKKVEAASAPTAPKAAPPKPKIPMKIVGNTLVPQPASPPKKPSH